MENESINWLPAKAGHFEVKSSVIGCADEGGASIESNVDALRSSAHPMVILQSIS